MLLAFSKTSEITFQKTTKMRKLFSQITKLLPVIFLPVFLNAQDSIKHRIIFIGDAGEIDKEQQAVIPNAAEHVLVGKTTVVYLGDNIYPHGMGLPGSEEEERTKQILQSQYGPMRQKGAPVYFIPGNHDWDKSGPDGLAKIKRQWEYLNEQGDSLLQLVPPNGCSDPKLIDVTDSLVIIAFDSEWWLYPFDKTNDEADCNCNTKQDVLLTLQSMFYENRYKTILLANHHPFQSYGTHGGYFSLKDHLFPLTVAKKGLYIPLPIIGSLYPFLRGTFTNPEDVKHPLYQDMISSIDGVFKNFPNLIHVSGHEHGLQLIKNPETKQIQIVSGAGAKHNHTIKGKYSLFGEEKQGYVMADIMLDNSIRFSFFNYQNDTVRKAFDYAWKPKPYRLIEDSAYTTYATDSVVVAAHPSYNRVSSIHRFFFGESYRREWATPAKLPVIHLSQVNGGLAPQKLGGGFQSTSLRLVDKNGTEYALRNVEKRADLIVPLPFQGTFAKDLLDDATTSQHPYSALTVPPVASAVGVPHSIPIIGVMAPDSSIKGYQHLFNGKVALLEEREPLGKSDNTAKMQDNLQEDNDNSYDAANFLRARMIDLLFADWDRHADQWRFYNQHKKGEGKYYIAIPRDRDMALYKVDGIFPTLIRRLFIMPHVWGFKSNVLAGTNSYLYKSSFLNAYPASQLSHDEWTRNAQYFKTAVTDSVLEASLKTLPAAVYTIRHDELLTNLKNRRDKMPEAVENYYRFSNKIVDIHTSDKNEFVNIVDSGKAVQVTICKINKNGELKDTLMSKIYPASLTREIRLYVAKGDDSIVVNNSSAIKLRIIGGKGQKAYHIIDSRRKIKLYDREDESYYGKTSKLKKHLSKDSLNTAFVPTNLYNTALPIITAAVNSDDGFVLGLGMRYMQQRGFRKKPYTSLQQFMVAHSFSTKAFNLRYNGEWINAIGRADLLANVNVKAPDNTQNFFGRGNETTFDKSGNFKRYYRTRFNIVEIEPVLRWRGRKGSAVNIGPALQYYHLDETENVGRLIKNTALINSYDSATTTQDKMHIGIITNYILDQRNNRVLPTWGSYINVQLRAMGGVSNNTESFVQITPEVAHYKSLNKRRSLILSNRIGGGISLGKTAFYQSLFLGGQGNLYGYRLYRFAGQHSVYNNLELRLVLSNFGNYVVRGQIGLGGFYDIGRVWEKGERSKKWHNGVGGNIYLAPASLIVLKMNVAYGGDGWYPFFTAGLRF
jgi:hypothetical protein